MEPLDFIDEEIWEKIWEDQKISRLKWVELFDEVIEFCEEEGIVL